MMNFASYTPIGEYSTAVATVARTDTLMDMSNSYILVSPATNAAKAVTAVVNVNDGDTLKTKNIRLHQATRGQRDDPLRTPPLTPHVLVLSFVF